MWIIRQNKASLRGKEEEGCWWWRTAWPTTPRMQATRSRAGTEQPSTLLRMPLFTERALPSRTCQTWERRRILCTIRRLWTILCFRVKNEENSTTLSWRRWILRLAQGLSKTEIKVARRRKTWWEWWVPVHPVPEARLAKQLFHKTATTHPCWLGSQWHR